MRLLTNNRPSAKPELWGQPRAVALRRLATWCSRLADPNWERMPYIATLCPGGQLLEVIPGDAIGKPIAFFGCYEFAVSALLRAYLLPGDVLYDVGANIGYFTVIAASRVGASGRVVAFEPSDEIANRLERNVELNNLSNVEVRREAASRERRMVTLVAPPEESHNSGLARVELSGSAPGALVRAVRLDGIELPTPALIKVDVEGHELDVFAGAQGLLRSSEPPALIFEAFDLPRYRELLEGYGYQIYQPTLWAAHVGLTRDLDSPRYRSWEAPNFFAAKSERALDFAERMSRGECS